ncbi:hypothetical protein H2199_006683 [Coniosporium tulheliwenetii]|uniref:Uncharacterized protein n=1 Tax=Coniosporium tulheliwenetii TaxID=3383036 RepID=A0ACC2YV03_9PEZI|nr:hypothetical protein H2199_006683 [Cladosporium sp. JES 115]
MALGGALKQIIWLLFICSAEVPIYLSAAIGGLNTAADTANTLLFLWVPRFRNSVSSYLGIPLYAIGIYLELASELQRRAFNTGLFALARHINYTGFALWRAGYAMAAAGVPWSIVTGGFFLWDFASRAVPSLEGYMREKYGEEWREVERRAKCRHSVMMFRSVRPSGEKCKSTKLEAMGKLATTSKRNTGRRGGWIFPSGSTIADLGETEGEICEQLVGQDERPGWERREGKEAREMP